MKLSRKTTELALVFAVHAGLLVAAQQSKPPAKARPFTKFPVWTRVWKSETTGKEYRVRVEENRFFADWVNIPAESLKQGVYIRSECRRVGTKWAGASRVYLLCPDTADKLGKRMKGCPMTLRFEVDSITPERISGHAETLRDFDCQKCEVRQTGWGEFVWVPKR